MCGKVVDERLPLASGIRYGEASRPHRVFGNCQKSTYLDDWISDVEKKHYSQIIPFIKTINNDLIGVKNAIDMKVNNGLAEGKVNLLKTIKRIMYGKSSFTT